MAMQFDDSDPRSSVRPKRDARVIRVDPEVYDEVLKQHTLAAINAMPYDERLVVIQAAHRRVAERQRQSSNDIAAQLREERRQRKAEAWAKRQPKGQA